MHVLYLPRWYPHRYDPMPGLFIERHARSVAAHCRVSVLYVHADSPEIKHKNETDVTRDEELLQLRVYFRSSGSRLPILRQLTNTCRFISAHCKGYGIIKKENGKADLLHVNVLTRLGVLAMIWKFLTGTPYVITEHWTRYLPSMDNFKGRWRKCLTRMVVKRASAVLPVTDNLRKAMESHGLLNRNYIIIPNVVDVNMFHPSEGQPSGPRKKFAHVSCFEDRQKNISGLLRVLQRLAGYRHDWECHMIGDGIHYQRLMALAGEMGLNDKEVIFHGLKENEELAALMREAWFQVMFSRFENLPVVILESFASGVPVLSTDVGGIREHLNSGLGMLIPAEDEEALFQGLVEMLDHPERFDKKKIRTYAVEHFSKEVIGNQLFDVYKDVV
jgi:glycosyltransferase involved in cell wall biosynthesis